MKKPIYPVLGHQTLLPFYLTGIGVADPEYHVVRENGLVSHQFLYTVDGQGVLKIDGKEFLLKKGSLFYVSPKVVHEYFPEKGNWKTKWLVFRGEFADRMLKNLGFEKYLLCENCNFDECQRIFDRIYLTAKNPLNVGEKESVLLYEFILNVRKAVFTPEIVTTDGENPIDKAIIYIEENFSKDIQLETLANISHMSLQHFCRLFKEKTSMRPMEYLAGKRISEAKTMLIDTDELIENIGRAVGYNDRNYFGIVFKKLEGITPGEYRRQRGSVVF